MLGSFFPSQQSERPFLPWETYGEKGNAAIISSKEKAPFFSGIKEENYWEEGWILIKHISYVELLYDPDTCYLPVSIHFAFIGHYL